MANVYDEVTRREAIQHRNFTDPTSARIIGQLVQWLDEAGAVKSQQRYNALSLQLGEEVGRASAAESRLATAVELLADGLKSSKQFAYRKWAMRVREFLERGKG